MKRSLAALLLILAFTTTSGAATTKKKARKTSKKPTTIEQTAQAGGAVRATNIRRDKKQSDSEGTVVPKPGPIPFVAPVELQLKRASSRRFDLRGLPQTKPIQLERAELEDPTPNPVTVQRVGPVPEPSIPSVQPTSAAPAPAPINVFEGLDRFNWGAGSPPDTNGDVGPNNYIQTVNTSIGVYRKSDGLQQAAFTFNTFMSQGAFGNLCDTNNFGDPVVLYDTFENRWIITDFAFLTDASGNVLAPAFQCFAASMTGDPVAGGWNFYSIQISDALNDYEKFGIWPDGLYMSANMFSFGAGSAFKTARAWAFNKAQMYAGSPTVKVVTFDIPGGDFAVMPSNARLQTGTPPPGRPNLFLSTWQFTNALTIYKFHVDWNSVALSTFTGPDTPLAATSWPNAGVANAAQPGTSQLIDVLQIRAMVQNQYTNFGGTESLWIPHTVRRGNTSGLAAPRWYQADVTGGTVAPNLVQATTWDPDGANVINRFMPSLALDRAGNMAMGYSTSNSTAGTGFPSIKYAGRLAADPINTFSQTEQVMFTGTASQLSSSRWGDYSGMALDPDGCTFWYTSEYATGLDTPPVPPATSSPGFNQRWRTKFGSFGPLTGCVAVGAGGTVSGTVTATVGGAPIAGATVQLGARSTTTDGSGNYSFTSIPAGTYPSMTASKPGFVPASASSIVVTDAATTTQNFSLAAAPASACLTDTTQADFLTGVASATLDLNTSPGDVTLSNAPASDQFNTAGTSTGTGFGTPNWCGQTFIAGATGLLVKADGQLFCNGCGATPPNLTLSVRATAAGLPTGADLATATIPGSLFASGSTVLFTGTFGTPLSITSGTQYALILRPVSAPAGSGYFWIRSSPSTYANGSRVLSADSGGTWSADTTRDFNFRTYVQTGYAASGNFVSSPKDSNPSGGTTPIWSTFSWNATTPANTSLQFQLAGSNNVNGPFNFVGPDGTAGTFFTTSPVQLSPQFYNFRFLEYKAFLATTNSAVTPTLSDATACFNDVNCSSTAATITPTPATVCTSSTGNTASGPAGMTAYAWGIANGTITSATNIQTITYTAGASGSVTLSLTVTAPNGCIVSGSTSVTINPFPATPTITPGGPTTFCAGGSVTLTSSSGSGNQWYLNGNPIGGATNNTYVATATGSYTVQVTSSGCVSAMSAPAVVTVNSPPPTPTVAGTTNGTGTQDQACPEQPLTLTATSSGATSFQWYQNGVTMGGQTNATVSVTSVGTYTVTATANGCTSAQSAGYAVQNPTPNNAFLTAGGPTTFCAGGSVTLMSNSATGIQWYLDGNPLPNPNNQNRTVSVGGTYTVILNALGCHSGTSNSIVVSVNPLPATPTATPGGATTFCAGGSVTLTSSVASGNQWRLNGNPIGGATNTTYVASASGSYTVTTTDGNSCTSAASNAVAVTVNPLPATPTITPGGPTTFCTGGSVTLTSSAGSGNQWYLNGNPIGGATNTTYAATASGNYTVTTTNGNGCTSASAPVTVTVNPTPATPTITPSAGSFCPNGGAPNSGFVQLQSSAASGNQWFLNGNPIGSANGTTYNASVAGSYTVQVTTGSCSSAMSSASTVTASSTPAPTITPSGPTTFCAGGSVTLTASTSVAGASFRWYKNGVLIANGSSTLNVTTTGNYTADYLTGACQSFVSTGTSVTVNPKPDATITAAASTPSNSTGNVASVANAGVGATYAWTVSGGTLTGGNNTPSITYTAGAVGTLTINVTVTNAAGCSDTKSANVTVTAPPVTVTSVSPVAGTVAGGSALTVNGTGFAAGATVTLGGSAATNVVVVSAIKITARTPAHAAGAVNVTVTNTDTSNGTLTNGYLYKAQQFDPNNDGTISPMDIIYLINYLYMGGPAPSGAAGVLSGDANGDGVVNPLDIFYLINYLFLGGPRPNSIIDAPVTAMAIGTDAPHIDGSIALGKAVRRDGHYVVPVILTAGNGSVAPQAMSLRVHFDGEVGNVTIRKAGAAKDLAVAFETNRVAGNDLSYLVSYGDLFLGTSASAVVAEIEVESSNATLTIDPQLTMLSNQAGTMTASVANGKLQVTGTKIGNGSAPQPRTPDHKVN